MPCDMDKGFFAKRAPFFRRGTTATTPVGNDAESNTKQQSALDQATKRMIAKYGAKSCHASVLRCSHELGEEIPDSARTEFSGDVLDNDLLIQSVLDASRDAMILLDETGKILRLNSVASKMFGSTETGDGTIQLAKGASFSALFNHDSATHLEYLEMATTQEHLDKILQKINMNEDNPSHDWPSTCHGKTLNGSEFLMHLSLRIVQSNQENNKPMFVACCARLPDESDDEEKTSTSEEVEQAPQLKASGLEHEAVMKVAESLIKDAADAMVLTDIDGLIVGLNSAAILLFGYAEDESARALIGGNISTLLKNMETMPDLPTAETSIELTPERQTVEDAAKCLDGTELSVLVGMRCIPTTNGSGFIAFDCMLKDKADESVDDESSKDRAAVPAEPISSWEAVDDESSATTENDDLSEPEEMELDLTEVEMTFADAALMPLTPTSPRNKLGASIRSLPLDIADDILSPKSKRTTSLKKLVNDSQGGALFDQTYTRIKELGEGGFATVHQCEHKITQYTYAVKEIYHDNYMEDGEGANSIREEIAAMKALRESPFIVRLFDVFQEPSKTYIVCEEMEGGDLLDRITDKGRYSEADGRIVARSLLDAVRHMHVKGWAHRDIKPENILLLAPDDDCTIKLCDFGCAQPITGENCLTTMAGSPAYAAPEIYNRSSEQPGYGEECDLWSTGVVLYVMLGGYAPFDADNIYEMAQLVCENDWEFHDEYWADTSENVKSLITSLLTVDRSERFTPEQALDSNWLGRKRSKLIKARSEKKLGTRSGHSAISRSNSFDKSLDDMDLAKAYEARRPQAPPRIIPMVWTGDGDGNTKEGAPGNDDNKPSAVKQEAHVESSQEGQNSSGKNGLAAPPLVYDDDDDDDSDNEKNTGPENRKSFFGFLPAIQDSSDEEAPVVVARRRASMGEKVMYWKRA